MLWCVEGGGSGGLEVAGTEGAGLRVTVVTAITVAPPPDFHRLSSRLTPGRLPEAEPSLGRCFPGVHGPAGCSQGRLSCPPPRLAVLAPPSLQFSGRTQGGNLSPCESRSQPRLLPRALPRPGAALPGGGGGGCVCVCVSSRAEMALLQSPGETGTPGARSEM